MKVQIALIALLIGFGQAAWAKPSDTWEKVYDATYDHFGPTGSTLMRISSDGQGHLRSETNVGGRTFVSVNDFRNKVTYSIDDGSKSISMMPMSGTGTPGDPPPDADSRKTSLGVKDIDGHNCEGWQFSSDGRTSETWIDTDIGCAVLVTLNGKTQMRLKAASKTPLAVQYFAMPTGYKMLDMAAKIKEAQEAAKKNPRKQR